MLNNFNFNSKFFTEKILNSNENIKQILFFLITLSMITLLFGYVKGNLINLSGLFILFIIAYFIFNFFKMKYKKKMKLAEKKFDQLNKSHLLTKLCKSKLRKKNICLQYENATTNYNKINDMLLKQYR